MRSLLTHIPPTVTAALISGLMGFALGASVLVPRCPPAQAPGHSEPRPSPPYGYSWGSGEPPNR